MDLIISWIFGHSPNNLSWCVPPTQKKEDDIDTQSQETRLNDEFLSETVTEDNLNSFVSTPEDDFADENFDDVGEVLIFLECAHKKLSNIITKVMSREEVVIYAKKKERKICELMMVVRKNVKREEVRELRVVRCEK